MHANSRIITSSQTEIHPHLPALIARHAAHPFRKPIADYNRHAFDASVAAWRAHGEAPLILDAGCGVGLSSLHLATQFPDHFVIGVDQSADRLARRIAPAGALPDNCLRVRADLVDYWRLLHDAGIRLARHYLLYPNPWPKMGHVARRWHGHPVFPTLLALGGRIECRSNWHIYVEELASALTQLGGAPVQCTRFVPQAPLSPFEQKYHASGHALWHCVRDAD